MESTLLEAIQSEEVMMKHWDCKLMFKEEQDGPEIDLLDYVNLSQQEEDKIPKIDRIQTSAYTNSTIDSMVSKTGPS
jgi:hypothetical protein